MPISGVIAAGDPLTARAGAQVLRSGGNAIDAVSAAAFASFVCELPLAGPLGAGLLLHGSAERGWSVLDFFARAPGQGGRPAALDFFPVTIDFGATTQTFHVGRGAAAVPGTLRGLLLAHQRYGRLPLSEVVAPARALAKQGFELSASVAWVARLLRPIFCLTPSTLRLMASEDGELGVPGVILENPGLGHLFEALSHDPRGALDAVEADLLAAFGPKAGGLLTSADLNRFAPVERSPLATPFAGHTVLTPPPPSAGGGLVALGLRLSERARVFDGRFGDRDHWARLARVIAAVGHVRRSEYDAAIAEPGYLDELLSEKGLERAWQAFEVVEPTLGSTTHISVIDGDGGAASLTTSNGEGCGYALESWGIHVNNFLGEEDINPRGFHVLPAGATLPTMMTPTIALRDGAPALVLGSGGSNRIRSAVLQALVNCLGFRLPLEDAVRAGRLHAEGSRLWLEAHGLDAAAESALRRAFREVVRFDAPHMFFGGVHAVSCLDGRAGRPLEAFGDPRRGGAVCRADSV